MTADETLFAQIEMASGAMVARLEHESACDPELAEALVTELTEAGARIGGWEIRRDEDRYAVGRPGEPAQVLGLWHYETAHGLVRLLNEGRPLHGMSAMILLSLDADYDRAIADAVHYRALLQMRPWSARAPLWEDRYVQARQRALTAEGRLHRAARPYHQLRFS